MDSFQEPWLRGPVAGIHPLLAPVFYALTQAQEDLEKHTADVTNTEVWSKPCGLAPVGFQLRHIAGSLDRLATYLEGRGLSERQLAFLHAEFEAGASLGELIDGVRNAIRRALEIVQTLDPDKLAEARSVLRYTLRSTPNDMWGR